MTEIKKKDPIELFISKCKDLGISKEKLKFLRLQKKRNDKIYRANTHQYLYNFLRQIKISPKIIPKVVSKDSKLIPRLNYYSFIKLSLNELKSIIKKNFIEIFKLQEFILELETPTGFNLHGEKHVSNVVNNGIKLLNRSSLKNSNKDLIKKEMVIAGYLHDIGNLVGRKNHSIYSIPLLTQVFSDTNKSKKTLLSFLRILEAILFHEIEMAFSLSSLQKLNPVALSLMIADKTDLSSWRVSSKANHRRAFSDEYVLVNFFASKSTINIRGKTFIWKILFSPKPSKREKDTFPHLLKRSERKWAPGLWQRLYREGNIEYLFAFSATFLRVYLPRMLITIKAVFALFKQIDMFKLVIADKERKITLHRVFTREDYEKKIFKLAKNLFKNQKPKTWALFSHYSSNQS